MLSRFSTLFVYLVAGLAVSAVATPVGQSGGYGDGTKQPSKHNSDQISDHEAGSSIYALLGGIFDQFDATTNIGHECFPSYSYGLTASKACTGRTVCCENTDASGLFAIGCTNVGF
ncbi:hypothetical protein EDB83DRAFT_2523939 [Lactarius deliciosus]|nr:hypothetical protein EDB83DRAFT_2523939 [Lactarius deliciosus]